MNKRQRLISIITASDEGLNNWYQSNNIIYGGEHDPTYCEYMNLRHRLGLEPDNDTSKPLEVSYHFDEDGTWKNDVGKLADQNRATWRKWIEEHKNDDIDLI